MTSFSLILLGGLIDCRPWQEKWDSIYSCLTLLQMVIFRIDFCMCTKGNSMNGMFTKIPSVLITSSLTWPCTGHPPPRAWFSAGHLLFWQTPQSILGQKTCGV